MGKCLDKTTTDAFVKSDCLISQPSKNFTLGIFIRYLLIVASYLLVVFIFGRGWLRPGLPVGDMGGTVAAVSHWRNLLVDGNLLSTWNPTWFCGHSRALFNLNGGMELAYVPFLFFSQPITAVKIGALVYIGLSGFSAFIFLNSLTRNKVIAYIMGFAYALHPIHLSVTAATSHANFPPYYFMQPILLLSILRLLDRPNRIQISLLAIAAALTAWVDFERVAVFVPWAMVIVTGILIWQKMECLKSKSRAFNTVSKQLKALLAAVFLAIGLLSIFLLPAVFEKSSHALFSEDTRNSSVSFFSIQNPLYYLDRAGNLLKLIYGYLPSANSHDAGTFYLGGVLLILVVLGVLLRPKCLREKAIMVSVIIAGCLALASAQGPFSGYESLCKIFDRIFLYSTARQVASEQLLCFSAGVIFIVFAFLGFNLWQAYKHKKTALPPILLLSLALSILFFAKPFAWLLRHFPPFAEMRNPGWFATAMPGFAVVIAASIGLKCLVSRVNKRSIKWLILLFVTVLLFLDIWPYRKSFDNILPGKAVAELNSMASILKEDSRQGRVLSRESYNPHSDLLYAYSNRPAAFYWLNWMAPTDISQFMLDGVYKKLHHSETIEESLRLASWANVRYIVYDLVEGPLPPDTKLLNQKYKGDYFALYENLLCKPLALISPIFIGLSVLFLRTAIIVPGS